LLISSNKLSESASSLSPTGIGKRAHFLVIASPALLEKFPEVDETSPGKTIATLSALKYSLPLQAQHLFQ
jgi:hypothetical protein